MFAKGLCHAFACLLLPTACAAGCAAGDDVAEDAQGADLTGEDGQPADDYTRTFIPWSCVASTSDESAAPCKNVHERAEMELPESIRENARLPGTPTGSPFPYACPDCDIGPGKPITNLVDQTMVDAVVGYDCKVGTDHTFAPYFPGIQAFNDDGGFGVLGLLGGDQAVADLYVKYALRSTVEGSNSDIQAWSLLLYYNVPRVTRERNGEPWFVPPLAGDQLGRGVRVTARANHSSSRLVETPAPRKGDQVETRLLGNWATTPDDGDFVAQRPKFFSPDAAHRARDLTDFAAFQDSTVSEPAWRDFMYRATYETAVALKCGVPVFAHSGGGSVVGFVLRLLKVSPLADTIRGWGKDFRLIGLEAVLSKELQAVLPPTFDRLAMEQLVVGAQGSSTYVKKIVAETVDSGQTPLPHTAITASVDPPGWNGDGGGHAGLGLFALAFGRIPGAPAFKVK